MSTKDKRFQGCLLSGLKLVAEGNLGTKVQIVTQKDWTNIAKWTQWVSFDPSLMRCVMHHFLQIRKTTTWLTFVRPDLWVWCSQAILGQNSQCKSEIKSSPRNKNLFANLYITASNDKIVKKIGQRSILLFYSLEESELTSGTTRVRFCMKTVTQSEMAKRSAFHISWFNCNSILRSGGAVMSFCFAQKGKKSTKPEDNPLCKSA